MAEFGLVESFGIDDGQLGACSREEAFVLGYEFCKMCNSLTLFESRNSELIHVENVERVQAAAKKRGKSLSVKHLHNDRSEGWCEVSWVREPQ